MQINFDIDARTDRNGRFLSGFYRPKITREVLERIRRLKYLEVDEKGLTVGLKYKGEKVFELFKNFFYGRAYYGDFYIGGDIPFESISVGSHSLEHRFEREVNLYGKTEEQIEERYEKTLEKFRKKMREIEERAGRAVLEDLKGLNLVEAYRDFTVFVNAKGAV